MDDWKSPTLHDDFFVQPSQNIRNTKEYAFKWFERRAKQKDSIIISQKWGCPKRTLESSQQRLSIGGGKTWTIIV